MKIIYISPENKLSSDRKSDHEFWSMFEIWAQLSKILESAKYKVRDCLQNRFLFGLNSLFYDFYWAG